MGAVLQNLRRSFGPSSPFFQSLSLDPPAMMEELYRRVDRYSILEDNIRAVTQTVMITSQSAEGNKPPGKQPPNPRNVKTKTESDPMTNHKRRESPRSFSP